MTWHCDPRTVKQLVHATSWVPIADFEGTPGDQWFLLSLRFAAVFTDAAGKPTHIRGNPDLRSAYLNWRWVVVTPAGLTRCPDALWAGILAREYVEANPTHYADVFKLASRHSMKAPDPQPAPIHQVETYP